MLKIDFEGFFDRKSVLDAVDKAEAKNLSKFGAYVRTRSRSSIRKRKKQADPGKPPSSHQGNLKRLIFFQYSKQAGEVVIGPAVFGRHLGANLLEYGGATVRKGKAYRYKGNPFMTPAFEKEMELGNHLRIWKDSVK